MNKYFAHFKVVFNHKKIVFKLMKKCGFGWQGFIHDFSKFGLTEFVSSAKYFQGSRSPIEAEKESIGYSNAWLHHKGHNKHHWEYWTDFDKNGDIIAYKIPWEYVVEMACDYVAAGMTYQKKEWTQSEPLNYHMKVKHMRHFHKDTLKLLEYFLTMISEKGLEEFCEFVKNSANYKYIDYNNIYCP